MRLGSDPEVFTVDVQTGKFLSIIGCIGAGKHDPLQIEGMAPGFTLQEDNVALEFGIPPASNADEFVSHIQSVMKAGLSKLPGRAFSNLSCTVFPADQMEDPMAFIFGCEPDFNAWTGQENPRPEPPHPFLRSAGGHIHIETQLDKKNVIRACDLFLGVPSVLMDNGVERKKIYGKAGACRWKPYGVEYRTLSNFWVFDEKLIRWAWRQCERALAFAQDKAALFDIYKPNIIATINGNDKALAMQMVKQFDLEVI